MPYKPIEDYGIIGDMHTVALVATDGSIDWLCVPHFDSPSVFGAILDDKKGGTFRIAPVGDDVTCKQLYWPQTNVLITRFLSPQGAAELTDFMPVGHAAIDDSHHLQLIRKVTAVRGRLRFRMECRPAFDYARESHSITMCEEGAIFVTPSLSLGLACATALDQHDNGIVADFTLAEGESAIFALRDLSKNPSCGFVLSTAVAEDLFRKTVEYWRAWLGQCKYTGRWREMVHRSALALKLMTFKPTGAIVAAPTCSLPENIGGERNWDYRYTWIRDSSATIFAFVRLGFTEEAHAFLRFLADLFKSPEEGDTLQIMYGVDGRKNLTEEVLEHLDGYKGSKPVRIGNGAYKQLQHDIYGELLGAAYLYNKRGAPITDDLWTALRSLTDWVCDNWRSPGHGIWEVRGGQQEFVYSKLMCWVTLDRALRLADERSFPAPRDRWLQVRDEIYKDILEKGWNEKRQAFVQYYGSDTLDAANLMLSMSLFMSPTDPRMLKTLDATLLPPDKGGLTANSLVYRYNVKKTADGLTGEEGTFNICTFLMVDALARAGRHDRARVEEARLMFERMLGFANHLGLYAEETGPRGEGLGNFPQAFTHLGLISAAINLNDALGPGA